MSWNVRPAEATDGAAVSLLLDQLGYAVPGARIVELHSHSSRAEARRFYERHGFEVTSNYFIKQL